jgi:hypothetical protein
MQNVATDLGGYFLVAVVGGMVAVLPLALVGTAVSRSYSADSRPWVRRRSSVHKAIHCHAGGKVETSEKPIQRWRRDGDDRAVRGFRRAKCVATG